MPVEETKLYLKLVPKRTESCLTSPCTQI